MTFTFSSNEEVDYAQLGMCQICAVRFTHGCEHSNTIESQQWLAAYIVAEQLDSESVAKLVAEFSSHPVDEAQKIERKIDATLDPRTPEQIALDEWQAEAVDVGYGKNGRPR